VNGSQKFYSAAQVDEAHRAADDARRDAENAGDRGDLGRRPMSEIEGFEPHRRDAPGRSAKATWARGLAAGWRLARPGCRVRFEWGRSTMRQDNDALLALHLVVRISRLQGRCPGRDFTLPELVGTGVRPHGGDVDVNRKRTGAHISYASRRYSSDVEDARATGSARNRWTLSSSERATWSMAGTPD
jgi:hypothetical protein